MYLRKSLTAEEKSKPYSKYYYQELAAPPPEKLAAMERPIDPAKALPLVNLNDLLNPGYFEVEIGWCVMPDGSGYVSNLNTMPGVTADMLKWWFAWHSLEPLRYKIWYPKSHYHVSLSDEDRAKVLDPNRSIEEKLYGITHHVVENIGGGAENIYISFMSPENCGFDMSRFHAPNVAALFAANGVSQLIDPPPGVPNFKGPAFMCHFIREIPGGVEMRTRFWMGKKVINKQATHLLPKGISLPPFVPQGLAFHNVHEFANLASFLPRLYEEQQGKIE